MAILEELGVLSTAQDLTAGSTDSENVIDLGAFDYVGFQDMFLDIVCETVIGGSAGTTSTYKFDLVVATEATLDTIRRVATIDIRNDVADPRIAAIDRSIAMIEVGLQIAEAASTTYRFLGIISTLVDGNGTAAVSINAAMSPSKPRTQDNTQVIRSNVGVPT